MFNYIFTGYMDNRQGNLLSVEPLGVEIDGSKRDVKVGIDLQGLKTMKESFRLSFNETT